MIKRFIFPHFGSPKVGSISEKKWIYNHRLSQFNCLCSNAPIVMLGDSLTENGEWSELLPEYQILNRGISGDTVSGVLNRLNEVIRRDPKLVVGLIGINDVAQRSKPDEIIDGITAIFEVLSSKNISVLWQSILYTSPPRDISNKAVSKINQLLENLTEDYGIHYIDINAALAASEKLSGQVSEDGLHLNGEGYIRWSILLKSWLDNHYPELRCISSKL